MQKNTLVISRHWDNPKINVLVTTKGIQIETSLDDFLVALAKEMGNPTMLLTKNMLLSALRGASLEVLEKIKEASAHA